MEWILCLLIILFGNVLAGQEAAVVTNQGSIQGVKIFPESSRIPINAYLGIPYASPPIGQLRFSPPEKHKGWSRTLSAQNFAPGCLQAFSYRQAESFQGSQLPIFSRQYSEDCLYLNVWVPDNNENEKYPVVIIFISEWLNGPPVDLPGQDLAAEGLVVVTVNYRLNIFGFFCLESSDARGNYGLLDQYYAMLWVRENIQRFRGDPAQVTLLGHSAGAVSIVYHMVSPRTKALFSRAILMSGNMEILWKDSDVSTFSRTVTTLLGCDFQNFKETIQCLKEKSSEEILRVVRLQYQIGNWSNVMSPVSDVFLPQNDQYLPIKSYEALSSGNFHQIPILMGLTNLEASESIEQLQDLARQGYHQLRHYIDYTAIPNILRQYNINNENSKQIKELIKWNYFDKVVEGDAWSLLGGIIKLYSDTQFEAPLSKLLTYLIKTSKPLYLYKYQQTRGVDITGVFANSTGASHTSELPYLFGPTLYQQLTRKRLSQQEERFSRKLKVMWSDFIKYGYPMSPRQYDAWQDYTANKYIQKLGSGGSNNVDTRGSDGTFWNKLIPLMSNISYEREIGNMNSLTPRVDDSNESTKHAMYSLLGLVLALSVLLIICLVLLKRSSKERNITRDFGSF